MPKSKRKGYARQPGPTKVRLRKNASIGAMGAEDDQEFLSKCFVDTGDYDILTDVQNPKCIVLGRTGAGKSALLETIKSQEQHVIELLPEELSLNYISNSTVLSYFENLGVNLDLFYQLLWRHILAVELIRFRYKITNASTHTTFRETLNSIFSRDKRKERAINYLREWGDEFWLETDVRVKELTTKMESELKGAAGLEFNGANLGISGVEKLSSEEKAEVRSRAQSVVNNVQIQELNRVVGLLADDIFDDRQKKYYIVIDKLDDNWVDESARHKLIRALIESIKHFRKIQPVKIILALRIDLLNRVFDQTRDAGFQEEKYEDLLLRIQWHPEDLRKLVDSRIGLLFSQQYTKDGAGFYDVFPSYVGNYKSLKYLLDRTFMRPRDLILYSNECLQLSSGKTQVLPKTVREAEISYSRKRLKNLCQEWFADYPLLELYLELLKKRNDGIKHSDFTREQVDEIAMELVLNEKFPEDPVRQDAIKYNEEKQISRASFLNRLLRVLYKVGAVGVKRDSTSSTIWSQYNEPELSESEVKRSSFFYVHPMFWRVLGINPREGKSQS